MKMASDQRPIGAREESRVELPIPQGRARAEWCSYRIGDGGSEILPFLGQPRGGIRPPGRTRYMGRLCRNRRGLTTKDTNHTKKGEPANCPHCAMGVSQARLHGPLE